MHPYVLVSSSVFIFSSWVLSVNLSSMRTFVAQVNYLLVPRFWMQLYVSLSCSKIYKLVSRQLTLIDCFLISVSLSVHSINFSLILGCCLVLYLYCVWKCLSKYICAAKHKFDFFSCFLIDSKEEKEFGIYAFENQSGNTEFVHPQNIHHSRASKMAPYVRRDRVIRVLTEKRWYCSENSISNSNPYMCLTMILCLIPLIHQSCVKTVINMFRAAHWLINSQLYSWVQERREKEEERRL